MRYFYIMGKYEDALQYAQCASACLPAFYKFFVEYYYFYSLTLLAVCKTSIQLFSTESQQGKGITREDDNGATETTRACQQRSAGSQVCSLPISLEKCNVYIKIVVENQEKLKQYSDVAPTICRHRFLLSEAELARVR